MNKQVDNFGLDELYNLAFRHILRLLENNPPGKQYEIWLREGFESDTQFGFHNVLTGDSIHNEKNIKPIRLVVNWIPNIYDAGRVLRRVVEVTTEYMERYEEPEEHEDSLPNTIPQDGEIDSDPQTPGVG